MENIMSKYYTLLINEGALAEEPSSRWMIAFGDFKRKDVEEERRLSYRNVPKKHTMIICTDGTQKAIDAEVKRLNAGPQPVEYRLGSSSLVSAPGIVRWAINGAKFEKDMPAMANIISAGWGVPKFTAVKLVMGLVPYTIDGETVVFTA
jgi:hypothetical protein